MEALPIPVLLIERTHNIVFANQSCEKISEGYKAIEGNPFHSLFPNTKDAETAQSMLRKVFTTRKTQILEGLLKIEDRKIWGRAHIRSLKLNLDAAILVLIEDLTLEKAQLKLQQRVRKELEQRVQERTADLAKTNNRLQDEITERKRVETELMKHRAQLREMVAERTNELNNTIKRLKREIRERLQVEQSLRASERRFNVAFRSNPGLVTISTVQEGKYLEVNDSFLRTTGYKREEVIGRTESDIGYWVRPVVRDQIVKMLLKKGAVHDVEALFRAKDGKMIVGSVSAELIELDGQSYVLTMIIDVTKRKQAETDRTLMTKAIEQTAESIFITDPKGTIQYANPVTQQVSGYTRTEIIGRNISFVRSPRNDKRAIENIQQKLSQGQAWKGHVINSKKDGSHYEVESTISPVKGQSGRITNFVAVERGRDQ